MLLLFPVFFFFFNDTATTEIYTLSLHDALPISNSRACRAISCTPSGVPTAAVVPLGARRRVRVTHAVPSAVTRSSARRALAGIELAQPRPGKERDQDLVMAGELDPKPPGERRTFHHVHPRPVVTLHVAVAGCESGRLAAAQVARDGEGIEERLGHRDRAADMEDDAAVVERGERPGESLEVAVARGAERGAIRRGMLVDDVGAECGVHGDGNSPLGGGEQEGDVAGCELGAAREVVGERFAHALAGARAVGDRGVHLAPGLLHHAKRAVCQPGSDVLTRASVCRKLKIVDGGAPVERQVGDDTAADELAEQGSQADLDDVPAEHRDDAAAARGLRELPGEGAEVLCGEDVREGIPEGGEARIAARRIRGRTTIASHFFPATPTRSRFRTSTITGLRSGRK